MWCPDVKKKISDFSNSSNQKEVYKRVILLDQ